MNKLGMMDDLFDFFFTVMMAFFIILFLGFVFSANANEHKATTLSNIDKVTAYHNLHNYLNIPVKDHGTMADLITSWSYDDKYEDQLEEETKKILNSFDHKEGTLWNLKIHEGDNTLLTVVTGFSLSWYEKRKSVVELNTGQKTLQVELYLACLDEKC